MRVCPECGANMSEGEVHAKDMCNNSSASVNESSSGSVTMVVGRQDSKRLSDDVDIPVRRNKDTLTNRYGSKGVISEIRDEVCADCGSKGMIPEVNNDTCTICGAKVTSTGACSNFNCSITSNGKGCVADFDGAIEDLSLYALSKEEEDAIGALEENALRELVRTGPPFSKLRVVRIIASMTNVIGAHIDLSGEEFDVKFDEPIVRDATAKEVMGSVVKQLLTDPKHSTEMQKVLQALRQPYVDDFINDILKTVPATGKSRLTITKMRDPSNAGSMRLAIDSKQLVCDFRNVALESIVEQVEVSVRVNLLGMIISDENIKVLAESLATFFYKVGYEPRYNKEFNFDVVVTDLCNRYIKAEDKEHFLNTFDSDISINNNVRYSKGWLNRKL